MESEKSLPADTRRVLDILSLVEDHILPFDPLKVLLILGDLEHHQLCHSHHNEDHLTNW